MLVRSHKHAWKMASNWVFVAIALLTGVEAQWDVFSKVLPQEWYAYVVAALALLGIAARLIDQGLEDHA